jgi:hypothetical protein
VELKLPTLTPFASTATGYRESHIQIVVDGQKLPWSVLPQGSSEGLKKTSSCAAGWAPAETSPKDKASAVSSETFVIAW